MACFQHRRQQKTYLILNSSYLGSISILDLHLYRQFQPNTIFRDKYPQRETECNLNHDDRLRNIVGTDAAREKEASNWLPPLQM